MYKGTDDKCTGDCNSVVKKYIVHRGTDVLHGVECAGFARVPDARRIGTNFALSVGLICEVALY